MDSIIELEPDVIAELKRGNKVSAIKTLRRLRGIGLKEAKEMVELYASQHDIVSQSSVKSSSGSSPKFGLLLVLAGISYIIYKIVV